MAKELNFLNKNCLVLGGTSGIGFEIASKLKKRGANVIIVGRNIEKISRSLFTSTMPTIKVDINNSEQLLELERFIKSKFKKLDMVFNCVGVVVYKDFLLTTDEEIKTIINTNLTSSIIIIKKLIPFLLGSNGERKYIVQLGSLAGIARGHKKFSIYSASKEGLAGLFKSLSAEFEGSNIKFVLVCPAGVKTEIAEKAIGGEDLRGKLKNSTLDNPKDVAAGILDNLNSQLVDDGIRLLPTPLSKTSYDRLQK